jgi:hypothetical protein
MFYEHDRGRIRPEHRLNTARNFGRSREGPPETAEEYRNNTLFGVRYLRRSDKAYRNFVT